MSSRKQPLLPNSEKGWTEGANAYRKAIHEDLYPKSQEWEPTTGGVTFTSKTGSYVRSGRILIFSVVMEGVSVSSGGYFDLPTNVTQAAVFSIADGSGMKAGIIEAGGSRVYLPTLSAGQVIISGTVVS